MNDSTPKPDNQELVYVHLVAHYLKHGYPPTQDELVGYTGLAYMTVQANLRKLADRGLIEGLDGKRRALRPARMSISIDVPEEYAPALNRVVGAG